MIADPFRSLSPLGIANPSDTRAVATGQRLRFVTPIKQPLLLISQLQRSGGTLVSQLLDGHSQLHVHPGELHIGRPQKSYWPNLHSRLAAPPEELFELVREKSALRFAQNGYQKFSPAQLATDPNLKAEVLPFIFIDEIQREIFRRLLEESPPASQRGLIDHYVTSYFNAWLDYQGLYREPGQVKFWAVFIARMLADPENFRRFDIDYPDGRIIVPLREPVSWFASARRHGEEYEDVGAAMDLWLASNRSILDIADEHPDRILLVRMDEMVLDTEAVARRMCRFLGLDFEPVLLRPTFNGMDIRSGSSFVAQSGIDRSSADRSKLVESEIAVQVERLAGPLYRRLLLKAAG